MRRFRDRCARAAWVPGLLVLVAIGSSCGMVRRDAPADATIVPAGHGWYADYGEGCGRSPPVPGAMRADGTAPDFVAPQPRAYCVTYRRDGTALYKCTCEKAPCERERAILLKADDTRDVSWCTELP